MTVDFSQARPVAARGVPFRRLKFMSGRLTVDLAPHGGLTALYGYVGNCFGTELFRADPTSSFGKLFRFQLRIDGTPYYPELQDTELFAEGFVSHCRAAGVAFDYELRVLDDAVIQRYQVTDNPENRTVSGRLLFHRHTAVDADAWNWRSSAADRGEMLAADRDGCCAVVIGGDRAPTIRSCNRGFELIFEAAPAADGAFFTVVAAEPEAAAARARQLRQTVHAECDALQRRIEERYAAQPVFHLDDPVLESAIRNAVPSVAALAVQDTPGAIRASQNYWVWGWDSMVHADALCYANAPELVYQMLEFYRRKADPERGIAHAFGVNFEADLFMAYNAQSIYITMLYNYLAATGNWEQVRGCYDFARELLNRIEPTLDPETGLGIGLSLFPDFPKLLEETGEDDLSSFNNSLYYQALRALSLLADHYGDSELAACCAERAQRVAENFRRYLFDPEQGYWFDSFGIRNRSVTRKHYPVYAILWVTPFARELCAGVETAAARFANRNFPYDCGLYMLPKWDPGFMADGNQLGAYYPPVDRLYWNLRVMTGDRRAWKFFRQVVTRYWRELTYPEGNTHESGNPEPTLDNPGCRQAFTAKSWYCDFLTLALGLSMDHCGLTFDAEPPLSGLIAERLVLRGKTIAVEVRGSGRLCGLRLNGRKLPGRTKIAWEELAADNRIELLLSSQPELCLRRADGVAVQQVTRRGDTLKLQLTATAGAQLYFTLPGKVRATVDGVATAITYDRVRGCGRLDLPPSPDPKTIVIQLER